MGKLARVASVTSQASFIKTIPRSNNSPYPFWVGSGYSDFLFPSVLGHATGCITGLGNVAPTVIAELWKASVKAATTFSAEDLRAAQELQDIVSAADGALAATGIGGTKYLLAKLHGYGGVPRRPLPPYKGGDGLLEESLASILTLEKSLSQAAPAKAHGAVNGVNGATNGVSA